ncbi:hypothetical protein BDC45DRAFT_581043 [Circinella umbellata]|nr:hypothetical protein BDC45DRAFT_581043 [Circinella umbellata]
MRRKEPCERCGTRRFKKKSDGTMVCKNGHVLLGWIEQTQDDGIIYTGRRRKRVKGLKHVDNEDDRYTGMDRESVIVQVCQTGLNLIVEYCVREFGFPENIQIIAQSIWEIYVIGSEKSITFDIFDTEDDDHFDHSQQSQQQSITGNVLKTMPMPSRTLEDELGVDFDGDDPFDKELPYMDTLYQIPDRVVRRLDRATIYTLKYIPYISVLNKDLRRYQICFEKHCGLKFSNENVPGLLHRLYPHFGLPDTFRSHASVILQKMQKSMVKHDKYFKTKDKNDDIQAVICMVMVIKILYYLDDRPEGKKNRPLPTAPSKESIIKNIQSSIHQCKNIKRKRLMAMNGENSQVNIAFLENLVRMLQIANFTKKEGLTFKKEVSSTGKQFNKQFDLIYLPSEQLQDLNFLNCLDLKKAKDQISNSPSVYDITFQKRKTAIYRAKIMSEEYRTLLELAACLIDVDISYLQVSLTRFEYRLRNFIG